MMLYINDIIPKKHTNIENETVYVYASELKYFGDFFILKLLFPSIFLFGISDTLSQKHTCI